MTYVKRRGMVLLVDDSEVGKYTGDGFEILGKLHEEPHEAPQVPTADDISDLIKRAESLKLDLPDGLTFEQVREAIEKAEQEAGAKGAKSGK